MYYLIKYPKVMQRLREEVDQVVGDRPPQLSDFPKMEYLNGEFGVWSLSGMN